MPKIECPICHSIDQAQRVTAIVEGETHDTRGGSTTVGRSQLDGRTDHYAGTGFDREKVGDGRISANSVNYSNTSINVTQQSRLAKKLVSPSAPTEPGELSFPLSGGLDLAVKGLATLPAALFWWWLIGLNWSTDGFGSVLLCGATLGVAAVIWTLLYSLISALFRHDVYPAQKRVQMTQEHQAQLAQYKYEKQRWEIAMNRWNAMFYCRRCDVVYVPGDTIEPAPPQEVIALAYAGAG